MAMFTENKEEPSKPTQHTREQPKEQQFAHPVL